MIKIHYSQKIFILIWIFLIMCSLCGCTPAEPDPSTTPPPSTIDTIAPPETTVPPTTQPSILSWDIPDYPQMSYEEYFSAVRVYGYPPTDEDPKTYYYSFAWDNGTDSCELWFQDGKLLAGNSITNRYVQVGADIYDKDDDIVACNEEWIFMVIDGKELIRMDYRGKNRQTLFVDETMKISKQDRAYLRDGCVLFFMAGVEDGYGIYRLYLPDMTLDLLTTSEERIWLLDPYSNHELSWFISNPEFETLYQSILDDPPPPYDEMIANETPQLWLTISFDYHIPLEIDYYYNTLTGEKLQRGLFGERSWGWKPRAWWLED